MARPKSLNPSRYLRVYVDARLAARVELLLFSEAEGKVPFGAWQKFFTERINDFLNSQNLDLAHIAPSRMQLSPGAFWVRGTPEALQIIKDIANGPSTSI